MRRLVYMVAVTLDGFIAGPEGGDPSGSDFLPVTPDLVEHLVGSWPETLPGPARDAMGISGAGPSFDTVVEGRVSYDIGLAAGLTDAYPHLRHLVVSHSLSGRTDLPVEIVAGDPVERVRELKAEDGQDIWLVGGGTLNLVLAAGWAVLGLWVISTGWTWLGVAQLGLGVAYLASAFSPRVAAHMDRPPFARRRRRELSARDRA